MTELRRHLDPLEELRYALAEGDAVRPPAGLAGSVLARALAARPPGEPVDAPPVIHPAEAFRGAVDSLDSVLCALHPVEWQRPALRGLDVQGLMGHLVGVERAFLVALGATDEAQADDDHVASTDPCAAQQQGRPPADTHRDWRAAADETMARLEETRATSEDFDRVVAMHGLRMPIGTFLVVRTFELWTHEEDIRRATARPLAEPDASSLRLMTALAVTLVPAGMAQAQRPGDGRSARIVLTGRGGGTWRTGLGLSEAGAADGPVDVRIVADAVDFCRLVANRIDPAALGAVVTGDGALARDLFTGASTLALD
jgi:uncharacterized protein (TIGR03083 family)